MARLRIPLALLFALCAGALAAPAPARTVPATLDPPDRLARAALFQPWAGEVRDVPNGPDLDLGYNDWVQVRLKVPAGAQGDLRLSYGTSVHPGFSPERILVVPAAELRRDGQPHTYRLDLGLEVWWRDTLKDLRLEAPAGASVEYVEVGDLPGDELHVNTDLNTFVGDKEFPKETLADTKRMESKHFVFWWSAHSGVVDKGFEPQVMGRRALRMSEECYQVYCRKHGFPEPFQNGEPQRRDGKRYKVNITSWYQGTWMGGHNGWTYYNIPGWGLRDEGWGNPVPHEFAHALQGMQPGFLTGAHWESHANYIRELRNRHFKPLLPNYLTSLERGCLDVSCFQQDAFRLIYADYRLHTFLDDLAPEMGLPANIAARLWIEGPKEMVAWQKLASLLPPGKSVKDVAGYGLRHWALLDFADGDNYRAKFRATPKDAALMDQATGSFLEPLQERPGWWRVPWARAPMRYAYMFHELAPAGRTVTVEMRGLDIPGDGEEWRWSLIAAGGGRKPRYSPVWAPGKGTLALQPGEDRVYVAVVATPEQVEGSPHGLHHESPIDRHPHFMRYPYELRIEGARPLPRAAFWPEPGGRRHPNGGGWVADTAQAAPTAYVGPRARVLDKAQVRGEARVEDDALVRDGAVVEENAIVSGCAWVGGASVVRGNARVRDHAQVYGRSIIEGDARVQGYAKLDNVTVQENAVVRGNANVWKSTIAGHAIADWDYSMDFELRDGVHFNHVPWGGWFNAYFAQTQRKPRGLVASYRFDDLPGEEALDEFGSLHGIYRGRPDRIVDRHDWVLRLNGRDQFVSLDRSVVDSRAFTAAVWCRPEGRATDQPLLFLGSGPQRFLLLTARDAAGRPRLTLRTGARGVVTLVGKEPVPLNAWTHLALTLGDGKARLCVNGALSAESVVQSPQSTVRGPATAGAAAGRQSPVSGPPFPISRPLRADDFLAANDYAAPQGNFVGRDWEGKHFQGCVEDVRFYNVVLEPGEIRAEMERTGRLRGVFLAEGMEFDGKSTTLETGVLNGTLRTLAAWVKPRAADAPREYAPIFDSRDERDGARHGAGIGLAGGKIRVRLDGKGFWETGVPIALDRWQHVALAFDGDRACLFLDGREAARTTYQPGEQRSHKNYRIGYTQTGEDLKTRVFFDGSIRDARIYDRLLKDEDVKALVAEEPGRP